MEFLSLLAGWWTCCLLYGASQRQRLFANPLPRPLVFIIAPALLAFVALLLAERYTTVGALLIALTMLCALLPLVTLASAYGRQYIVAVTLGLGALGASSTAFAGGL